MSPRLIKIGGAYFTFNDNTTFKDESGQTVALQAFKIGEKVEHVQIAQQPGDQTHPVLDSLNKKADGEPLEQVIEKSARVDIGIEVHYLIDSETRFYDFDFDEEEFKLKDAKNALQEGARCSPMVKIKRCIGYRYR